MLARQLALRAASNGAQERRLHGRWRTPHNETMTGQRRKADTARRPPSGLTQSGHSSRGASRTRLQLHALLRLRAATATATAFTVTCGKKALGRAGDTYLDTWGEEGCCGAEQPERGGRGEKSGAAERRWRGEEAVGSVRRRSNGRCSACSCGQARVRKLGSESMPCGAVALLGGLCRWAFGGAGERCLWDVKSDDGGVPGRFSVEDLQPGLERARVLRRSLLS